MTMYLTSKISGREIDADFKHASVWLGEDEIVKWDMDSEGYRWIDETIQKAGVAIDEMEAEAFAMQG